MKVFYNFGIYFYRFIESTLEIFYRRFKKKLKRKKIRKTEKLDSVIAQMQDSPHNYYNLK